MTHVVKGHLATLEVERGVNAFFVVTYVARTGARVPVAAGTSAPTLPMYSLVVETATKSTGAVVQKQSGVIGWKRRADALLAADSMVAHLGATEAPKRQAPADHEAESKGVTLWFSYRQLAALKKIVEAGTAQLTAIEASLPHVEAVVDRVDCAVRSVMAKTRSP